jgi:signal transduction histidine kinase
VQIAVSDTELTVVVADNGVGIASDRRDAVGSHGLATMRHRVRSFGGNLEIETMVPSGTRLRSRLPLALVLRPQQASALPAPVQPATTTTIAAPAALLEATDRGVA